MSLVLRHLRHQGPVVGALVKIVGRASFGGRGRAKAGAGDAYAPGPSIEVTLPPRDPAMVADYLRHLNASPGAYDGALPPHLFPQWGFPLMSQTLRPLPYDFRRVLNAGCRMEVHQPLPADQPLRLSARLVEVDDDGRRALITQELVTGTAEVPRAVVSRITALVPLPRAKGEKKKDKKRDQKKEPRVVPASARELERWQLSRWNGLAFAALTGDINPLHWLRPYARLSGFKNPILHGFDGMSRAIESMNRCLWDGDPTRLEHVEVRFVRPLVLPADVGVYVEEDGRLFVGEAPGAPATMVGTFHAR